MASEKNGGGAPCPACNWTGAHALFSEPAALRHADDCPERDVPLGWATRFLPGWWIAPAVAIGAAAFFLYAVM